VADTDSNILITSLRNPALYSGAVSAVELLETHISWVLLAGEFAYKLKKPVDLGFVDFTTLEKREHYCHEELRLNRRFAPELYLDVVPITGSPQAPVWGGEGTVIEYAVRMRRFPQEVLLSNVIAAGGLKESHIDDLARRVAKFHAEVAVADEQSPFGTADAVLRPAEENFRRTQFPGREDETRERLANLRNWTLAEHQRLYQTFAARKANGFIRECHGDLHLGNMVLLDGRVTLFDCIEFNEHLRWIDVLSEVAFLVMDLADRGRPDLGHRFLNAYLECTGDYAGLAIFRFYSTYRALVRAKVACLRAEQGDLTAEEINRLYEEFRGYLALAESSLQPPPAALILCSGVSGSGKSTGTQPLVERLPAIRIRSDVERKRLFGLAPEDRPDAELTRELYSGDAGRRTYERMAELARTVITAGHSVILDATFLQRAQRKQFGALARELGVPFVILEFEASPETLRARVQQRMAAGKDASDATLAVLDSQLAHRELISPAEREAAIVVTVNEGETLDVEMIARRIGGAASR